MATKSKRPSKKNKSSRKPNLFNRLSRLSIPVWVIVVFVVAFAVVGYKVLNISNALTPPDLTFSLSDCNVKPPDSSYTPCGYALEQKVNLTLSKTPGQKLKISPGTYDVGKMRWHASGTSSLPITITAADPSNPPLLKGWTKLHFSNYIIVSNLRFQATIHEQDISAFAAQCGHGWQILHNEIFGASDTGAFANLTIAGDQAGPPSPDVGAQCAVGDPSDFRVASNLFHDPYYDPSFKNSSDSTIRSKATHYHHIYIVYEGSSGSGGFIDHNVFVGHKNGPAIKIGTSDGTTASYSLGPWGVQIFYNTFYNGESALVFQEDVRKNVFAWNLVDKSRKYDEVTQDAMVTSIKVRSSGSDVNIIRNNFGYDVSAAWRDLKPNSPDSSTMDVRDTNLISSTAPNYNSTSIDPSMVSGTNCLIGSFQPQYSTARSYGITGSACTVPSPPSKRL